MSLESDLAQVLRAKPVDRISFKVHDIAIDKSQMEAVAKAIENQDISVAIGSTGFAAWSSLFVVCRSEI